MRWHAHDLPIVHGHPRRCRTGHDFHHQTRPTIPARTTMAASTTLMASTRPPPIRCWSITTRWYRGPDSGPSSTKEGPWAGGWSVGSLVSNSLGPEPFGELAESPEGPT